MEEGNASREGRELAESMHSRGHLSRSAPNERRMPGLDSATRRRAELDAIRDEVQLTIALLSAAASKLERLRGQL